MLRLNTAQTLSQNTDHDTHIALESIARARAHTHTLYGAIGLMAVGKNRSSDSTGKTFVSEVKVKRAGALTFASLRLS